MAGFYKIINDITIIYEIVFQVILRSGQYRLIYCYKIL